MRAAGIAMLCIAAFSIAACQQMAPWPAEPKPATTAAAQPAPPTSAQMNQALTRLNHAFQDAYERILDERGSRSDAAPRAGAFNALESALRRLGMIVESRDPDGGTLTVAAPAPRPLTLDEWHKVVETDGPLMAGILCPILGEYCRQVRFNPDDYVIVINATVLPGPASGSRISLTTRMREIVPRPGVPRRDYPPPTGVRMALDKIWAGYERERGSVKR